MGGVHKTFEERTGESIDFLRRKIEALETRVATLEAKESPAPPPPPPTS